MVLLVSRQWLTRQSWQVDLVEYPVFDRLTREPVNRFYRWLAAARGHCNSVYYRGHCSKYNRGHCNGIYYRGDCSSMYYRGHCTSR